MAMNFAYNKSQLEVGAATAKTVSTNLESLSNSIENDLMSVVEAGTKNMVDLYGSMSTDGMATQMGKFNNKLKRVCALAAEQGSFADRYNQGEFTDEMYARLIEMSNNKVYPDTATRVLATIGMGVAKFAEGFLSFFENIGDGVVSLGAGVMSLFGADDIAKKMKDFAARDLSTEFIENNSAFEWLNEASYFDKDSAFAKVCKFAGKATAAAVTSSAACKIGTKLMESSKGVEAAAKIGEKAGKITDKATGLFGDAGEKLTEEMGKGKSFKNALATTAVTLAVDEGLGKVVKHGLDKPLSSAISGKLADTALEKGYKKAKSKATEVFGEKVVDTAEDIATSQVKKNTTGRVKSAVEDQIPIDSIGEQDLPEEKEVRKFDINYES